MIDKTIQRVQQQKEEKGKRINWLAFLNTVRTERFEEVLALRPVLSAVIAAQADSRSAPP
jgi:hypothetical protein